MALIRRRPRNAPRGRYTPKLWSVWIVAPLALLVVGALSFGLYHYVYGLLAHAAKTQNPRKPVNVNDVIKTTVTVLTLTGAVLAGVYAYRKQLLSEGDAHRADASQLADRYTTAAEQLGHDQAAVRLAGVYALARLADDWEEQRQVCIDVLCAYLRMPYEPDPSAPGHKAGERQVRHTIIRVIRDHLRVPDTPTSWCACDFDFTGATFDGGDLSGSTFCSTVDFTGATFSGGEVAFGGATFSSGLSFRGATFTAAEVFFGGATFSGGVNFVGATFSSGRVSFVGATFSSGRISFRGGTFSGSEVAFGSAIFNSDRVSFLGATFSGGEVSFSGATFNSDEVSFRGATFTAGRVYFGGATFSSSAPIFDGATFTGTHVAWGNMTRPAGV
ncbi:pentapeptide repeat-containing protein [Streptomyces sp. NPDC005492]|uniref:pentapeptide repeat-containing protein n=1 Tax=Streptomyces sp. NPDC005492 TaxID=3156883 RepID=UPI0033B3C222